MSRANKQSSLHSSLWALAYDMLSFLGAPGVIRGLL